ncbi:hypothetical protein JW859_08340 [bacterium]|nr:hypothetical protein [bacterium]
MELTVEQLPGYSIEDHLAHERQRFDQARIAAHGWCLFYVCDPCVVLGSSNEPAKWVHTDRASADGLPVLKRCSGGGTVYLDRDVLNYSFILPRTALDEICRATGLDGLATTSRYIAFFRQLVIGALADAGGIYSATGISDISLNGRKISGNAQRIASTTVLHHGTIMFRCPLAAIERYLPIPPDRPGVDHAGFLTGLAEEGINLSPDEAAERIANRLRQLLAP